MPDTDAVASRARALALARIVIGGLVVVRTTPMIGWLQHPMIEPPTTLLGWPVDGWTATLGPHLPAWLVAALCIARTSAALVFMLGLRPRITGLVAGVAGLLVFTQEAFGMTHTFRLLYGSLIVLAVTDCAATWAVQKVPVRHLPSGELLVRAWVTSIYACAAMAKLRPGWWNGTALALDDADGSFPYAFVRHLLRTDHAYARAAVAVLIAELGIAALLVARRTRRLGVLAAVAMQVGFEVVARPDVFGVAMLALLYVVWVSTRPQPAQGGVGPT